MYSLPFNSWINERLIQIETQSFVVWKLIRIIITSNKEFLPQLYTPASSETACLLCFTLGNLVNCSRSSVKMKRTTYGVILTNLSLGCLWKFYTWITWISVWFRPAISCALLQLTIADPITGLTQSLFTCAIAKRLITEDSHITYQSFQSADRKKPLITLN